MLWRSGRSLRQIGVAAGQRVWNRHPEGWVHRAGQVTLEHQPAAPRPVDAGYRHGGTQRRGVMVARTFAAIEEDPTVYHTMNGPNEFHVIGTMRDWTIVDRLHRIETPTLVFRGFYDEATEACVQPFLDLIPYVEGLVFSNSSHMPQVEEKHECLTAVGRFLAKHD